MLTIELMINFQREFDTAVIGKPEAITNLGKSIVKVIAQFVINVCESRTVVVATENNRVRTMAQILDYFIHLLSLYTGIVPQPT